MKIGILTFHRAHNYGAVLQCYALQEVVKSMGHEVEVIDYRQPWTEKVYKVFSLSVFMRSSIMGKLMLVRNLPKRYRMVNYRKKFFSDFNDSYLDISMPCHDVLPQYYDVYLIGSDQLWSASCMGGDFDDVYLGDFVHPKKSRIVGYALSSNRDSIIRLSRSKKLAKALDNFYALSFREKSIASFVAEIIPGQYPVVLDPTLLTDKNIWEPLIDNRWRDKNFVLIHQVRSTKHSTKTIYHNAMQIASLYEGCEIVDLSTMKYSISDFVSAFKYAKHVLTTSFHATIFSIIFNTPFTSFRLNDGHDNRYVFLLESLGATFYLSDIDSPFNVEMRKDVCPRFEEQLSRLQTKSLEYLKRSLNGTSIVGE